MNTNFAWILSACAALIAAALVSGYWLAAGVPMKDQLAIWDLVLKAVAGLLALSGAGLAIIRYLDDQAKNRETAILEARKPFLIKQQDVYGDLLTSTANVSTIENYEDPGSISAERDFWVAFWGSLPLVADERVACLADRYAELLASRSTDWVALRNTSMEMSRACRASLGYQSALPSTTDSSRPHQATP